MNFANETFWQTMKAAHFEWTRHKADKEGRQGRQAREGRLLQS